MKNTLPNFNITVENGLWKGYKVWYVTPEVSSDFTEALPYFVLNDGNSFRRAAQPLETLELMKFFGTI